MLKKPLTRAFYWYIMSINPTQGAIRKEGDRFFSECNPRSSGGDFFLKKEISIYGNKSCRYRHNRRGSRLRRGVEFGASRVRRHHHRKNGFALQREEYQYNKHCGGRNAGRYFRACGQDRQYPRSQRKSRILEDLQ